MIELDEGYFTVESSEIEKDSNKRGRGAVGQQNVAVMADRVPLENPKTGKKEKSCRYFKAKVLETHTSEEINEAVR